MRAADISRTDVEHRFDSMSDAPGTAHRLSWIAKAGVAIHGPLLSILRRNPNEEKRQNAYDPTTGIHSG